MSNTTTKYTLSAKIKVAVLCFFFLLVILASIIIYSKATESNPGKNTLNGLQKTAYAEEFEPEDTIKTEAQNDDSTLKVEITKVIIDPEHLELDVNDSYKYTIQVYPGDAENKFVALSSSNTDVVITNGFNIIAVGKGEAVITATSANGVTAKSTVVVSEVFAESISMYQSELTLTVGENHTFVIQMTPGNITDRTVTFVSDNPDIVKTDGHSTVTAVSKGKAIVTVKTSNGIEASCEITVQ